MKYLKRLVKPFLSVFLRLKAHGPISRLCSADVESKLLGDALEDTVKNNLTSDEKEWIDRIEALREKLNSSTTKISIIDYGAGEPGFNSNNQGENNDRVITRTIGEVCREASKPYFWSLLLFKLIRNFRPSFCLELGTCVGVSASFQAAALKLNGCGSIATLEGAKSLASLAEENFQELGLDNVNLIIGRFQETLDNVLKTYNSIDFVFIDGHHDERATIAYFYKIMPFLSRGALLVFDDVSWSKGMKNAWKTIQIDERVKFSIDLWQIGVCIIDGRIEKRKNIKIPLLAP